MKTEEKNKLLDKYYKGETSQEEENLLKNEILLNESETPEKDIFNFFKSENSVPEDLESLLSTKIEQSKQKIIKMRRFRITSAATIIVLLTAFTGYREIKNSKIENELMVIEQALYQVSQSIQPEEQEEMVVLWVDEDVEIIIN